MREGTFRDDLYFRLRVAVLTVPPLRERRRDVLSLADRFLGELAASYRLPARSLAADAREAILAYRWPGNVRELRNTLDRALLFGEGETIGATALGLPADGGDGLVQVQAAEGKRVEVRIPEQGVSFDEVERALLEGALRKAGGNQSQAARLLGMSRDTLRYRLEKFAIEATRFGEDAS